MNLAPAALVPEVLLPLQNGAIVRCPDGTIGHQTWGNCAESHVFHDDRRLGRGPWIFERWQVEPATPGQASEYAQRCLDLAVQSEVRL